MQYLRDLWRKKSEPYIYMALTICKRNLPSTQRENERILNNSFVICMTGLIFCLSLASSAFAQAKVPDLSVLPWQLIGLDNEFATRNAKKLEALHAQLLQNILPNSQSLDLWLEAQGRVLPYNLKHSLHRVATGKAPIIVPSYVIPIICRIDESIIVATELAGLSDNFLLSSRQQFTSRSAWEGEGGAPLAINAAWASELNAGIHLPDKEAAAFKLDLGLLRSSHNTIVGTHECLNMLVAHELQKTMMVPTPLDLLEGYRLRQNLFPASQVKRSTRTLLVDWGMNPTGPRLEALVLASESVLGSKMSPRSPMIFEIKASENRIAIPAELQKILSDTRNQLLAKDLPQVAKIYGAWVYLDRGRAWGLDMNDRLYFEDGDRFVKGHVVGFYGSGLNLKSPRGFAIQEGAIVFVRKGQRQLKIGDSFGFDPTEFPTPWPAVRQPIKAK